MCAKKRRDDAVVVESEPRKLGRRLVLKFSNEDFLVLKRVEFRFNSDSDQSWLELRSSDKTRSFRWTMVPPAFSCLVLRYLLSPSDIAGPFVFDSPQGNPMAVSIGDDTYKTATGFTCRLFVQKKRGGSEVSHCGTFLEPVLTHGGNRPRAVRLKTEKLPRDCIEVYFDSHGPLIQSAQLKELLNAVLEEREAGKTLLESKGFPNSVDPIPDSADSRRAHDLEATGKHEELKISAPRLFHGRNDAPRKLVGRRNELKKLDAAWSGANKKNIIVIAGWGGSGKTSLVAHWSRELRDSRNQVNVEDCFDWPFDSDTMSVGNFFKEAFEHFEDKAFLAATTDDRRIGERLVQLANQRRSLLILDGLEQLRDPKTGGFYHGGLDALLRGLAQSNKGLCVVTIRPLGSAGGNHTSALPELALWHSTTVDEWPLDRLTREEGAHLLGELGVMGMDIEKGDLCDKVKGHPLTLTLTGNYLARCHAGDIQKMDRIKLDDANGDGMNDHAFSVIAAYESWLSERNDFMHLAVLEALGLFDRPATPDCLVALAQAGIGHFSNRLPSRETDWNLVTYDLVALGLLEARPWVPVLLSGHADSKTRSGASLRSAKPVPLKRCLDTHLLVREYFAKSFKNKAHVQWQSAHACLFGHLQRTVSDRPQETPDDSSLDLLCHAVVHGCHAGELDDAWKVFRDRIQRGETLFATRIRGKYDLCRQTLQCFLGEDDAPLKELSRKFRSLLLHQYGEFLRAQGRLRDAVDAFEKSFSAGDPKKKIDVAKCAMNIAQTYMHMGELRKADALYTRSIELAQLLPASLKQTSIFSRYAEYLWEIGSAEAYKWHKRAEDAYCHLWEEENMLRGYSGFLLCEYLLENGQFEDVERRRQAGLPSRFDPEEAGRDVVRGIEHLLRVLLIKARREAGEKKVKLNTNAADEAVRLLASSSEAIQRVRGLIVRAWLWAEVGNRDDAIKGLNNAEYLASRGEMKLFLIDIHLQRAKLQRNPQELELARTLIQRTGSKRRLTRLEIVERETTRW